LRSASSARKELQRGQNEGPESSLFRIGAIEISAVQYADEKLLRQILCLVGWVTATTNKRV
jgi:hypothetical protein